MEPSDANRRSAGRKPIPLELDNRSQFVVGIDLERIDALAAVLTDLRSRVVQRAEMALEKTDPEYVADVIATVVRDLCGRSGISADNLRGVGVGAPGIIDYHQGLINFSIRLGWRDVPLESLIRKKLDVPVLIDSGSNVAILGEKWQGTLAGIENLIYITHRIGLGAGFTIHGEIYRGTRGTAGEIGHLTIDPQGRACACGNRGCLEAIASEAALVQRAQEEMRRGRETVLPAATAGLTADAIYTAAMQRDPLSLELVRESARNLAIGLANLVNLLNPEVIVVSGGITRTGALFFGTLEQTIAARALHRSAQAVKIMESSLGRDDVLIGAASLVLNHVFRVPEVRLDLIRKRMAAHVVQP